MKKDILCTILGAVAALGVKLFGGWDPNMIVVIIMMGIDLLTGFLVAAVFKESPKSKNGGAESWAMFKGLCRKFAMICLMAVAHQLDVVIGVNYIMMAVTYGFIANEALSIVENAGLMGIVKSQVLINAIDILKQKENKDSEGGK